MSELIYYVAVTVDGFIADKNGDTPAHLFPYDEVLVADFFKQIKQYDTVLMGANTYTFGYKYGLIAGEQAYKGIHHIIFSKGIDFTPAGGVELISGDAVAYTKKLKLRGNKKIWLVVVDSWQRLCWMQV